MTKTNKYIHLLLGILFVISATTAIIILVQFSRPELIKILESCANENGCNIMPADSLKFAEVIRHKIWNFHIISGIILFFGYIIFLIRIKRKLQQSDKITKYFSFAFGMTLALMLITGLLYLQPYSDEIMNYKNMYAKIHYCLAFLIGSLVLWHIINQITKKKNK